MKETTPQGNERNNELPKAYHNNFAEAETTGEAAKESSAAAKGVKPVYQTYIYRSYGGGYQGL